MPAATTQAVVVEAEKDAKARPVNRAAESVCLVTTDKHSLGTGFVVKNQTLIATNLHVVAGAGAVRVTFSDGTEHDVDGFVASSKGHDLVVLHLAKPAKVPPLEISVEKLSPGDDVFAIGAPKGLSFSFSKGVISAYRHWPEIEESFESDSGIDLDYPFEMDSQWVQTTTPISPGNSGGPLLSPSGQVVGINTLRSPSATSQNINFSIYSGHLVSLLNSMPKGVIAIARLSDSGKEPGKKPRPTARPANAAADVAAWDTAATAMGHFMLDSQEVITSQPVQKRDREAVRGAARLMAAASLVALEKIGRIETEPLTPVLAAYIEALCESLQECHKHARDLGRAANATHYTQAQSEDILDGPFEVLFVQSLATGERLNWLYRDDEDVYIGCPFWIQEHDIERATLLSKKWPTIFAGKPGPVPDCPYEITVDILWDIYWRSEGDGGGKVALETMIRRFPDTEDATQARQLLRKLRTSTGSK